MTPFGTKFRYGPVTQAFHWLTALMVMAAWLTAHAAGAGAPVLGLHETVGVTVFVLVAFRLLWRSFDRLPGPPPRRDALLSAQWLADVLLYVLLFLVPVTGIIGMHEMQAAAFAGLTHEPGHSVLDLHRLFGNLLILIAGLHSAFALFHHFVRRDRVLRMMLPGGPPARTA